MNLKLERPLVFFDLETTSKDVQSAKIVELAAIKINVDGTRITISQRFNPGIPIPKESTEIHGIKDSDVASEPSFLSSSQKVYQFFFGCDLGGFNSNKFDIPILYNSLAECRLFLDLKTTRFIDVGNIFKIMEQRTLTAAYKVYCNAELSNAHSAIADIDATVQVFEAQILKYPELPNTLDDLHLFCNYGKPFVDLTGKFMLNDKNEILFTFGKHNGKAITEVAKNDISYLRYILDSNFPEDVKQIVRKHLKN